jgi:deoxyribose-phosphate aldolase
MTKYTYSEIAGMIDHSLLNPTLTDSELINGCRLALEYEVAAVCIKPYAVKQAKEILKNSNVKVCTVIGFPHGNSNIETKIFETQKTIADGAEEIDMVVNIGKVLSEDYLYIEKEITEIVKVTKIYKVILKVIFENDYLIKDLYKIKLCEICSKAKVEFIKTSTGYGFKKMPDGTYNYDGSVDSDLILMRKYSAPEVKIKAAGGIRTLDDLLRVKALGVSRVGASATKQILDELKKRNS